MADGETVLQRITITKALNPDGTEFYRVDYEDQMSGVGDVPWLDALGLLEAAKFDLYERNSDLLHPRD